MFHLPLALALFTSTPSSTQEDTLLIDPLLLAQAAQVWLLIGGDDNPVWPGWSAAETPLLFYFPGKQDVLVNHPSPPRGFTPFDGEPQFAGFEAWVRTGRTEFDLDGQNTARSVEGVQTLVVADTLSNLRSNLNAQLAAARAGQDVELGYDTLATDCYDQMAMIAHEAFHVYQFHRAPDKAASEQLLFHYPVLSAENNVGVFLEGEALSRGLTVRSESQARQHALAFLAARQRRRATIPASSVEYEDGTEFNEGLAKYVEWALIRELEGEEPLSELFFAAGFHGFDDLAAERRRMIDSMRGFLTGDRVVNNDPYGTAPVRFRLYWSGMGIGALLDRLGADWTERILQPGTTLTGLLEEALDANAEELAAALEDLESAVDLPSITARMETLHSEGVEQNATLAADVLDGDGTTLVFDHSRLGVRGVGLGFTPFGIRKVAEDQTLFTQIPIKMSFLGHGTVTPSKAFPVLQHQGDSWLALRLETHIDPEDLLDQLDWVELSDGPGKIELTFPGVTVSLDNATPKWQGENRLVFVLEPA